MRTIQDIDPDYRVDWYRTPPPKEVLAELNVRSDWKGFLQAGGYLASILATGAFLSYAFMYLHWGWWLVGMFLHGTTTSFCINAIHELVHGTVFKTKKLNDLFAWIFGLISMTNFHAFWASHSEHHKYTLHDPEDSEVVVPVKTTLRDFRRRSTIRPQTLKWSLRTTIRLALGIPVGEWGEHLYGEKERRHQIYHLARITLAVHGAILAVTVITGLWWLPVVTTLHICYFHGLQFILNQTQHVGLQDHVDDFRLNSRTFHCNPLFRFLYWNMNYHIEHHMYAGVPCYNLHKLHEAIKHELPYSFKSVAETWFHIITCIYRQKHEPDYVYIPLIPGGDRPEEVGVTARNRTQSSEQPDRVESARSLGEPDIPYKTWECTVCGFIYDERLGLPEEGIASGTRWEEIPDDWKCPDCGVAKADFTMREISRPKHMEDLPNTVDIGHQEPIVFIGSGMATFQTIREFRKLNQRKPIIVVTQENGDYVYKPSLSNAFHQDKQPGDLVQTSAETLEQELDITLYPHREVEQLDVETKELILRGGERLRYSRLVLAVGATPRKLSFPGTISVNNLTDYKTLREKLPPQGHLVIVGAGLVGCEFANDFSSHGYKVSVIESASRPLERLATPEQSEAIRSALEKEGVQWFFERSVSTIQHGSEVELSSGECIHADAILSAIGLEPRVELAKAAGIHCGNGISVDDHLRTSSPDVFALGDCAEIQGVWAPYIGPILSASKALARTLSGTDTALEPEIHTVQVKTPACPLEISTKVTKKAA